MLIKRRRFCRTSAGILVTALAPGLWSCAHPSSKTRKVPFRPYTAGEPIAPITQVTPDGFYVHTYYDICPFSPSQRYLATTRLPYQDHNAVFGDAADVCVIDLKEETIKTVFTTKSWGFQTGALLNWGASDRFLYTNDVIDGTSVCVRIDLEGGTTKAFAGPLYHIAPDESCVISFPLELLDVTQVGYGVPSKDPKHPASLPPGAAKDQGLWRTDLRTDEKKLLVSLADLAARIPEPPPKEGGTFYLWHSRFNPQGTRIHQILRCVFPDGSGGENTTVFTFNPDGSDIRFLPTDPVWGLGGGHPNWHGDGTHLIRNIPVEKKMRFCQWRHDGAEFRVLSNTLPGGGHPRVEPRGRYLVTDAFPGQGERQMVRLRWIDLETDSERVLCTLPTLERSDRIDAVLRLDGHPAWSRDFRKIVFQAAPGGARQLFIADVSKLVA